MDFRRALVAMHLVTLVALSTFAEADEQSRTRVDTTIANGCVKEKAVFDYWLKRAEAARTQPQKLDTLIEVFKSATKHQLCREVQGLGIWPTLPTREAVLQHATRSCAAQAAVSETTEEALKRTNTKESLMEAQKAASEYVECRVDVELHIVRTLPGSPETREVTPCPQNAPADASFCLASKKGEQLVVITKQ